jgi:hypothetical protein
LTSSKQRPSLPETGLEIAMTETDYIERDQPRGPSFLALFVGKTILLALTIVVVWLFYGYLVAFQLDWLGWIYTKLQPLTNALYALVDNYFPENIKYKFRAAITDDLGQRALFLLLLTAAIELTLYTIFRFMKFLFVR